MNKTLIIVCVIIMALVLGLAVYYYSTSTYKVTAPNYAPLNVAVPPVNQNTNVSDLNQPVPPTNLPPVANTPVINANKTDYQPASVGISNFSFNPKKLTVKIGTTVTWTNDDPAPHTIAFADFTSQTLNTGDTYSYTFTQAGTYDYYCSIHPSMKGQIIVAQ